MKIRIGFVSNSSSESFLIYGTLVDREKIDDAEQVIHAAGLIIEYGDPDMGREEGYVGRSWGSVGDDETGRQFKESIQVLVFKIFGASTPCRTHYQSWYNG